LILAQSPKAGEPSASLAIEVKGGTGSPKQSCPLRTVTQSAAQVAPQQSLILRTGAPKLPCLDALNQRIAARGASNPLSWVFRFSDHAERGVFEAFAPLCYKPRRRLEEVLSMRRCVEAYITLSLGIRRLRSW